MFKEKMIVFCLGALLVLTLSGCARKDGADHRGDQEPNHSVAREPEAGSEDGAGTENGIGTEDGAGPEVMEPMAFDRDIVSELFAESGILEVYWEEKKQYDFDYDYRIPRINEDSDGAREINGLIREEFGALMEKVEESGGKLDEADMISWCRISYETFWNRNILSIVITSEANYEDFVDYKVYNYDAALGERVSNEELLAMHNIPADEFLTLARITAVREFDWVFEQFKLFYTDSDTGELLPGFYTEMIIDRNNTIQNEYNRNAAMPLYLDGNGELTVVCCISVPVGGGGFYACLPLARDVAEWEGMKMVDIPDDYYDIELNSRVLRLYEPGQGYVFATESKLDDGTDYKCEYYLGFDSEFPGIFVFRDYSEGMHSLLYKGSLKVVGVDENGFIFDYKFTVLNGNPMPMGDTLESGRFYLNPGWSYDAERDEYENYAVYRHGDGGKFFETDEEEVKLALSVG